jgi:2,3-bisphosphoglycerate-dependent phosphoglycerate mutase
VSQGVPQRALVVPARAAEVVLVRHGASAAAVPGERFELLEGRGDPPLSPEGRDQARRVAARLALEPLSALVITPLRRTGQTAAPLAARTGLRPTVVPELAEVSLGQWEGGEWRIRVAAGDPLAMRVLAEERWDLIPGGESAADLAARVQAGLDAVVSATGPGGRAAAVVHGGVIGELCRQATASRPFAFVHADNGSLTRLIVLEDGSRILRSFNDTAHLDGPGARPRAGHGP